MLCPKCRSWNFRDYRFCRECGTKLDPATAPADDSADPRVEELLHHAFTALDQGELDAALNKVQEALALQPGSAPAHSALGAIYEGRGMISEAIQQVEMALQLNPDCTADREKLERLRTQKVPSPRTLSMSRTQVAGATAIIAATLVFGIGAAVLLRPQPAHRNGASTVVASGATGTSPSTGRAAARGPAAAWGVTQPGDAAKPGTAPGGNSLTAVPVTTPPVPGSTSAASPSGSATAPGAAWGTPQGAAQQPAAGAGSRLPGLPSRSAQELGPAPVGQVLPLEPAAAQETGSRSAAAPSPPAAPGAGLATTEPSEPETGFIQIDAGAGARRETGIAGAAGGQARSATVSPAPPRIEISIGRGGGVSPAPQPMLGSGSPLAGAKQTERQAFAALRRRENSEAGRLFRAAERQYGGIATRGGSEAGQAAEGLATCRQMLDRLR